MHAERLKKTQTNQNEEAPSRNQTADASFFRYFSSNEHNNVRITISDSEAPFTPLKPIRHRFIKPIPFSN